MRLRGARWIPALPVVAALLGCGMMGQALDMTKTNVRADPKHYDAMAAQARKLGWKATRGGSNDWDLLVVPAEGQEIIVSTNVEFNVIAYDCNGGPLEDDGACVDAVNKLFSAIGVQLPKD